MSPALESSTPVGQLAIPPSQLTMPSNPFTAAPTPSADPPHQSTIIPETTTDEPSVSLDSMLDAAVALLQDDPGATPSTLDAPHPSPPVPEPQPVVASQPRLDADGGLVDLASTNGDINPPFKLINVKDEPSWMKKKRTLEFFRKTFKLGNLVDVVEHCYELEGLLGFQETVSLPVVVFRSTLVMLTMSRPQQGSQFQNAPLLSVYFTRMRITTERITGLRFTPLVDKSWSGGPRFLPLVDYRASVSAGPRESTPSLFLFPGGARSSGPSRIVNVLTASARSRTSTVSYLPR